MITLSKLDEDDWNNNKFTTLPLLPIFWNKSTNNLMTQDEIKTGIEENLKIKTNNFAAFQITLESKILLAGWFPLCFSDINLISIVFDYISALHEMVLRNNYNINMYNDIRTLYASSLSANYDSCFVCLCCQNKLGDHLTIICLKCGARFGNCCWTNGCIWNSRLRDIRYIESNSKSIYRVKSEHCPGCLSGLKQQQKQNINIFDNNNNNDTNQVNQKQQRGPTNPVIFYPEGYTDDERYEIRRIHRNLRAEQIRCIQDAKRGYITGWPRTVQIESIK